MAESGGERKIKKKKMRRFEEGGALGFIRTPRDNWKF